MGAEELADNIFRNELGGTAPEQLPTPKKSMQQLQREEQKRLKRGHNCRSLMSQKRSREEIIHNVAKRQRKTVWKVPGPLKRSYQVGLLHPAADACLR
jgi:hypothetical protein